MAKGAQCRSYRSQLLWADYLLSAAGDHQPLNPMKEGHGLFVSPRHLKLDIRKGAGGGGGGADGSDVVAADDDEIGAVGACAVADDYVVRRVHPEAVVVEVGLIGFDAIARLRGVYARPSGSCRAVGARVVVGHDAMVRYLDAIIAIVAGGAARDSAALLHVDSVTAVGQRIAANHTRHFVG